MTNALDMLALKKPIGVAHREELELAVLLNFDAARRGQCTDHGANVISKHLMIAMCIASMKKNRKLYDLFARAVLAFSKATARQGLTVSLTTGEYKDTRDALVAYLKAVLPVTDWKELIGADAHVSEKLGTENLEFLK